MDGTVISGRWGEPDDVAGRWADDPYPPPYDDPYGYGEPYGDHYGEPYGDAYDRSGLGMLTRITVIKDRIVDIEQLPVRGSGFECVARDLMDPPRAADPPPAPQPAPHDLQLAWLEQVAGGAEALAGLDVLPLAPGEEAEPDLSALGWPTHRRLERILARLDELAPALLGPEGAIVARRIAVRAVLARPGILGEPDRDATTVGAIIHAAGKGNDLVGPTKLVMAKEIQRVCGLPASGYQRARAFAEAVAGGRLTWPAGWHFRGGPEVLFLGGGDLLVSDFRRKLVLERDRALAMRALAEKASLAALHVDGTPA